jgi:hypothetical protein
MIKTSIYNFKFTKIFKNGDTYEDFMYGDYCITKEFLNHAMKCWIKGIGGTEYKVKCYTATPREGH